MGIAVIVRNILITVGEVEEVELSRSFRSLIIQNTLRTVQHVHAVDAGIQDGEKGLEQVACEYIIYR